MSREKRILVIECIEKIEQNKQSKLLYNLFYEKLFAIEPKLKQLLSQDNLSLNRKFFNMLSTFKGVKHLDKISEAIISMGHRHKSYGMTDHFLLAMKAALFYALEMVLKNDFIEYKDAWENTYTEVAELMKKGASSKEKIQIIPRVKNLNSDILKDIGGIDVVTQVHKKFYDDIFEHPWLGKFFYGKDKRALVKRQTEFMMMSFGDGGGYTGETPSLAHMHMYLTEEMILEREKLLRKAILSEGISFDTCEKWIELDHFFGSFLVKKSPDECVLKCFGQSPVIAEKPVNYKV